MDDEKIDEPSSEQPFIERDEGLNAATPVAHEPEGDAPTPSSAVPETPVLKSPKRSKKSRIENLRNKGKKTEGQVENHSRTKEERLDEEGSSEIVLDVETRSPREDNSPRASPNEEHISEPRSRGSTPEVTERREGK